VEVVLVLAGLIVGLVVGFVIAGRRRRAGDLSSVDTGSEQGSLTAPEPVPDPGAATGVVDLEQPEGPVSDAEADQAEVDDDQPSQGELQEQELESLRTSCETLGVQVEDLESQVRRYRRWAGMQMTRMSEELEKLWKLEKLPVRVHQMDSEPSVDVLQRLREVAEPLQASMDDLGVDAPEVHHRLGLWHALEGRGPQAAEAFEEAVRNGMGAQAWLALGDSLWGLDRRKKARSAYQQSLNLDKRVPVEILRRCAQVAFVERRYADVVTSLKPLFNRKQTPVEVFLLAGQASARDGDREAAIAVCETGLKHHPESAALLSAMIVPLSELGNEARVQESYDQAREIDPELADAPVAMGMVHLQAEEHDEAVELFDEALELNIECAEAHFCLGVIHNRRFEYKEALEYFTQAVELKPDYAEAYYNMKDSYDGLRDFENSIAVLKRAVQLNPEYE